ncbi:MAG: 16S rRNA (uracil(1498)-N(3))-methyltransferase [Halioglobus sp.]
MRTPRIYTQAPLSEGTSRELEQGPSQHIARALRMQVDDALVLFDGSGAEYPATITSVTKKHVSVAIGERQAVSKESPLAIHLGIALSRGERMDFVIQKATELGVTELTPLFTERVEVKLNQERSEKKLRHWEAVAISACEQSGRNTLPSIHPPRQLVQWLDDTAADLKLVMHHRADKAAEAADRPGTIALLIGPEGGLSQDEINGAESAGYRALQLGPRVLRTETAPLAAIAILQSQWGDMKAD